LSNVEMIPSKASLSIVTSRKKTAPLLSRWRNAPQRYERLLSARQSIHRVAILTGKAVRP
jgi:hypothetical protein